MNAMYRPIVLTLLLGFAVACVDSNAQTPSRPAGVQTVAATKNEALIDALIAYPFGDVYSEDVSSANSITHVGKQASEADQGIIPVPPVRAIANLGQQAIPLLIAHLTDQRPSQAKYREQPVPAAYLALDLLLHITDMNDERVVVPQCEQHGLGDCMQPDFYFSPDTSDPNTFSSVQKSWLEENKKQPIKFVEPTWWR